MITERVIRERSKPRKLNSLPLDFDLLNTKPKKKKKRIDPTFTRISLNVLRPEAGKCTLYALFQKSEDPSRPDYHQNIQLVCYTDKCRLLLGATMGCPPGDIDDIKKHAPKSIEFVRSIYCPYYELIEKTKQVV